MVMLTFTAAPTSGALIRNHSETIRYTILFINGYLLLYSTSFSRFPVKKAVGSIISGEAPYSFLHSIASYFGLPVTAFPVY
jgi:hypothetical protein